MREGWPKTRFLKKRSREKVGRLSVLVTDELFLSALRFPISNVNVP